MQVMSILGRTGGSSSSEANKQFSAGFGWANGDVAIVPEDKTVAGPTRRSQAQLSVPCDQAGAPLVNKLVVSSGVLLLVASLRWMAKSLYVRSYPTDPDPPDLSFPAWEVSIVCMPIYLCLRT